MTRLDAELVRRRLARSRGDAQRLVAARAVQVGGAVAVRASTHVEPDADIAVDAGEQWVSRAAYKLVEALDRFGPLGLGVSGRRCLDAGASTGGFTQVLLSRGARAVVAVDVGHGQLAEPVRSDPRVDSREGTNIRDLQADQIGGPVDLLVADLSFISLRLVLGRLRALTADDGDLVILVKPQFEVGRSRLGKNGIVRSDLDRRSALTGVLSVARDVGLSVRGLCRSPVSGSGGNAEYLLWCSSRRVPGAVCVSCGADAARRAEARGDLRPRTDPVVDLQVGLHVDRQGDPKVGGSTAEDLAVEAMLQAVFAPTRGALARDQKEEV